MLMSLLSHILSAWFAFLLPCYATFKALSHRPLSEPDLQRWAMYWSVIGAFVAFEYVAEWLISWLPFYWEIKTVFLLFLSLPQTQGSTYIYNAYLQPFFIKNEADLDAGIVAAQQSTLTFLQARLASLWEFVWSLLNKIPASGQPPTSGASQTSGTPSGGGISLDSAIGLWKTYSPSVLSAFQPSANSTSAPGPPRPAAVPTASSSSFQGSFTERNVFQTSGTEHPLPNPHDPTVRNPSPTPPSFPEPQLS